MLNWFKKNGNGQSRKNGKSEVQMADIDGNPLSIGDWVQSLRYDLGVCKIVTGKIGFDYESVETGDRVSYVKMIDAATSFQKVRKIVKK